MTQAPRLEPALLTIFGITGNLAQRKLLPALYQLVASGELDENFVIVGITRRPLSTAEFMETLPESLQAAGIHPAPTILAKMAATVRIISMDITNQAEYARLKAELNTIEEEKGRCMHRLFYLAIPSTVYAPIIQRLGKAGLNHGCQHHTATSRLLIEKPFGYDLTSAKELISVLSTAFDEEHVFRIDHYLAKATVQNIIAFRQQNPVLTPLWNRSAIQHVQVTAFEAIGVEGRAAFYEPIGALRDVIQSHLLQILALVMMDPPSTTAQNRQHILSSLLPPPVDHMPQNTIRAQYDGYRQEVGNLDSHTETFAAVKLTSRDPAWRGVPLILATGKNLSAKKTAVTVRLCPPGSSVFSTLEFAIDPSEGIRLDGPLQHALGHSLQFPSSEKTSSAPHGNDAYAQVFRDALRGDHSLFATSQEVLASWHAVQPILDAWQRDAVPLFSYQPGTHGPAEYSQFIL